MLTSQSFGESAFTTTTHIDMSKNNDALNTALARTRTRRSKRRPQQIDPDASTQRKKPKPNHSASRSHSSSSPSSSSSSSSSSSHPTIAGLFAAHRAQPRVIYHLSDVETREQLFQAKHICMRYAEHDGVKRILAPDWRRSYGISNNAYFNPSKDPPPPQATKIYIQGGGTKMWTFNAEQMEHQLICTSCPYDNVAHEGEPRCPPKEEGHQPSEKNKLISDSNQSTRTFVEAIIPILRNETVAIVGEWKDNQLQAKIPLISNGPVGVVDLPPPTGSVDPDASDSTDYEDDVEDDGSNGANHFSVVLKSPLVTYDQSDIITNHVFPLPSADFDSAYFSVSSPNMNSDDNDSICCDDDKDDSFPEAEIPFSSIHTDGDYYRDVQPDQVLAPIDHSLDPHHSVEEHPLFPSLSVGSTPPSPAISEEFSQARSFVTAPLSPLRLQ